MRTSAGFRSEDTGGGRVGLGGWKGEGEGEDRTKLERVK